MKLSRPLILLALAAIVPLIVLSALLGARSLRQEQVAMQRRASARVELAAVVVERELDSQIAVLTAVAQSVLFDGPLDRPAALAYLKRIHATRPEWLVLNLSDPVGTRIVTSGGQGGYPDRIAESESLARAVATGRPVVGRIMRQPNNALTFAVRAPVMRGGKALYVISAVTRPERLRRLILDRPLPPGWRGGVIDASGRVVVRSTGSQDAVGGFASSDTLKLRSHGLSGVARVINIDGEPLINAYRRLPDYGWSVHAAIPMNLYRAPVIRSLWLMGGAAVACLLLATLFLFLLARELRLRTREEAVVEEKRRMEGLGRITGGVAHDFNNILMIVQGSAEMMKRRRGEPERVSAFADGILSAAQRGQALTRQLLAFARRSAHEPVDFRLQDRSEGLAEMIRRSLRDDIVSKLTIPPETWPVRADPDALEIALINLAVNARDAMPEGGALEISAANLVTPRGRQAGPADLAGDFVAITVKDTGVGVPEQNLGQIFEPFFTTKPTGRGTGLGLSQVYGFARQSGGAVTVASTQGEGATFTLYLPRATSEPSAPAPPAPVPPVADAGRLLLVEDDADVARTLEAMLSAVGYTVVWASDGQAALALTDDGGFDVVLADLVLGSEPSGLELLRRLRHAAPDLPAVLMSGYPEAVAEVGEAEIVLQKPFGPDQALDALRRARAARREARRA